VLLGTYQYYCVLSMLETKFSGLEQIVINSARREEPSKLGGIAHLRMINFRVMIL
jgi:hypothetical protein